MKNIDSRLILPYWDTSTDTWGPLLIQVSQWAFFGFPAPSIDTTIDISLNPWNPQTSTDTSGLLLDFRLQQSHFLRLLPASPLVWYKWSANQCLNLMLQQL